MRVGHALRFCHAGRRGDSAKKGSYLLKKLAALAVTFTEAPEGRAMLGGSSGGIASFIAAWYHPDLFRRVIGFSPSFVAQESPKSSEHRLGAWNFHEDGHEDDGSIIAMTEPAQADSRLDGSRDQRLRPSRPRCARSGDRADRYVAQRRRRRALEPRAAWVPRPGSPRGNSQGAHGSGRGGAWTSVRLLLERLFALKSSKRETA
jgi:pimeloyl-ACP methyl ester carboxylesterase